MDRDQEKPIKILFVCLGNICRSPAAEAVCLAYLQEQGLERNFSIDSAGISGYHAGELADERMRRHGSNRGYHITSLSRPLGYADFYEFDYLVGMDMSNKDAMIERCPEADLLSKISILTEWHSGAKCDHVPDPYYGGAQGFEDVLDLVEDCIPYLIHQILKR